MKNVNLNAARLDNGTYALRERRVSLVCVTCGASFLRFISQMNGRLSYCSHACRCLKKLIKCTICGNEFSVKSYRIGEAKFCSKQCHDVYQSRNKVERICVECRGYFSVSPSRVVHDPALYCSEKCYRQSPAFKEALIKGNLKQQNSKTPTRLEVAGERILGELGILFIQQVLVAKKFVVDAIIPSHSLIIQWDGDYWHGYGIESWKDHPEKRVQKRMYNDISQDAYFRTCGFTVLRFWEHDVFNDPLQVRQKIELALNARP